MDLYILRHAKAEERSEKFADDSKRPLTKEGIKTQRAVNKGMAALKLKFDFVLSSPFLRTKDTAQMVAKDFETKLPRYSKHLAPDGELRALVEEITEHHSSAKSILIVGHEPSLSRLVAQLVGGTEKLQLSFKKSGLCKLTVGELRYGRCAKLEWMLAPKQLQLIGK